MPLPQAAIRARLLTTGLPTFPRTIARLEHLIVEAEAAPQVVAAVIATDPAIATLVIGQANAAGHATTSLTEAIRRIGLGVSLSSARSAIPAPEGQRAGLAGCWAQGNAVAVLLPLLVDYRRHLIKGTWDAETLHLIGLTHDLGHILALSCFPHEYGQACRKLEYGDGRFDQHIAGEIGASTMELAAMAARARSLPDLLVAAMSGWRTPDPDGPHAELTALVHVAHALAHAAGFVAAGDTYIEPLDDHALSRLNLRTPDCEAILNRLFSSMDELELYEGALRGS